MEEDKKKDVVYISGAMTGLRHLGYEAFDAARDTLEWQGYEVISPADMGRAQGFDATTLPDDTDWNNPYPDIDMDRIIEEDINIVLHNCDAVAMLPGWEMSKGARAEKAVAEWKNLTILYQDPCGLFYNTVCVPCKPPVRAENPKQACGDAKLPVYLWPTSATMYGCVGMLCGALKYGSSNFREAPILASTYFSAICRHLFAWWEGEDNDPVDGTPHLAYLLANPAILVDAMTHGALIDDRAYKGMPAYAELNAELTRHVARLKEMYKDRNPVHYSALSQPPVNH